MAKTIINVPTLSASYTVPGVTFNEQQVRNAYSTEIAGLSAMQCTTVQGTDAEGSVTTHTFSPRTGNKG